MHSELVFGLVCIHQIQGGNKICINMEVGAGGGGGGEEEECTMSSDDRSGPTA